MRHAMPCSMAVMCLSIICSAAAQGENWPGWRGPRGDGTSSETNVPVRWNGPTGENIKWKVPIPGRGYASPVVWEDHIFLASCLEETQQRQLLCLDRATGELRWQKTVLKAPLEKKHRLNSFASSTPAASQTDAPDAISRRNSGDVIMAASR